ncbi:hypothetical protein [Saccharopolyspora taberi]|uniref:DUF1963 domain-containing protein n=1 Tax=Saccharopolyspora taberi TaxID=60895 RepID=A0ABN3V2U1_9PSEU
MRSKLTIRFTEAAEPITEPVTKFGGQPVWLEEPTWPLSAETGRPMRFVGQIRLPGDEPRLAYLFITDEEDFVDGTHEPAGGENALFAQPGEPADFYQLARIRRGPMFGPDHQVETEPHSGEFGSALWGEPEWLQGEEEPDEPGDWRFVLQLDSSDAPFELNFGDLGIGYAYLDEKTGQGRFLWQCG